MALFVRPRPPAFLKESLAKNLLSRLGPLADARAVWVMDARSRVSAERKYSTSRPCGTQEGGLPGVQPPALAARKKAACPGCTPPPLRHARRRLAWGATPRPCRRQEGGLSGVQPPALAARKKAACLGCNPPPLPQARRRPVLPGHGPACPVRPRTWPRAGNYENFVNFGMLCLTAAGWVLIIRKELVQKETIFLGEEGSGHDQ